MQIFLFYWVSLGHSITVGFAESIFFDTNFRFISENFGITWHSPRRELPRLGEPKRLYEEKLSRFPGLPYPAEVPDNSLTRVVSPPRRVRDPNVNGWLILKRSKLKVT